MNKYQFDNDTKQLIVFILNNFLTEEKPIASYDNLKYFEIDHIIECMHLALKSKKLTADTNKRIKTFLNRF